MDIIALFKKTPCGLVRNWIASQLNQSLAALYEACPRGDWLLWALEDFGFDCSAIGYWCAERARQSALRALDAASVKGPKVDALRACAPVVDRKTARAVELAADAAWVAACAASAAVQAGAVRAAAAVAGVAAWEAGTAVWAAAVDAANAHADAEAEYQAIADHVRETFPWPVVEAAIAVRQPSVSERRA